MEDGMIGVAFQLVLGSKRQNRGEKGNGRTLRITKKPRGRRVMRGGGEAKQAGVLVCWAVGEVGRDSVRSW